ncbi:hypothetical protein ACFOZY_10875 [Chungangia koreensis]|uniref:Uncharacterized protein n=1 Tax=Chungangia koreensis TaxID=752657 RepID=A0ABV8X7K1_9LACT
MNKIQIALPALILFVLFAPNFVSADGFDELKTIESVEKTVQQVKEAADSTTKTSKDQAEESSLAKPITNTVETVSEEVEEPTIKTEPISKPVQKVIEKTKGTVQETTKKVEETVVKPITEKVVEPVVKPAEEQTKPIVEKIVEPVNDTIETVEEGIGESETIDVVEDTISNTEEKLDEIPVEQVVMEEEQLDTSDANGLDQDVSTNNHARVEDSYVTSTIESTPIMREDTFSQNRKGSIEKDRVVKQSHQPINKFPLNENPSFNNQAVTAQTIQVGSPSATKIFSTDLGVSAYFESLKMDFAAEIRWRNPEEAGKSQWSHAPPGEPPKSLSFLNDVNNI